jgi:hypothetical protein
MCHKPLTPLDAWFFRQKNYSTKRLFWGFLLAGLSNFYRTALVLSTLTKGVPNCLETYYYWEREIELLFTLTDIHYAPSEWERSFNLF